MLMHPVTSNHRGPGRGCHRQEGSRSKEEEVRSRQRGHAQLVYTTCLFHRCRPPSRVRRVYHPEPPHAQSAFLFPIVFGINFSIVARYNREVLQTEFRFRFRKSPRQISAGPGWSTPEEVEPNFLFCKPNFLFRFGSSNRKKCVVLATRCIVISKNTTEKLNLCLLLDHYSWN